MLRCSLTIIRHRIYAIMHEQYGEFTRFFNVLVFHALFYKRNRKHFPLCSRTLQKHSWKFEITQNCVETLALRTRVIPTSISRSPKLPFVFL